jgi:hypothetical protein
MNLRTSLKALVLIIPFALAACASQQEASSEKDIVDTAVEAGQFNTLVAAVQAADLVDTLKSDGPFTVFAPTDAAFAKLPDGTVENLLKPENKDQLVAVLTYHVVSGKIMSCSDGSGQRIGGRCDERRHGGQRHGGRCGHRSLERCDPCDRHSGVTELNSVQGIAGGASSRRRGPCLFERGIREPT